ncbi:MAG: hypothetical protein K2X54_27860 [Methylobacterium organophilum]|nr:hypothetical protein [Methylobacterium organophilum]
MPPLDASKIAFAAAGGVVRLVGQGILAAREAEPIEPGRIREVRADFRRRANSSDPSNDTVRTALLWVDQAKNPLPGPAISIVADLDALTTASGRQSVVAYVSASAGEGVTIVAPPGAVYFRRFVYNFGLDGITDVETLASVDVTGQVIPPAVTTDFLNRLAAQESQNAGARLNAVEAAVQNPNSVTYPTLSDAQAASPPTTVTTIILRGRDAAGDGLGRTYKRVASIASGAVGFTSANGAKWQRVEGSAGALDLAVFGIADANIFVSSAPYIPGADALFGATTDRNGNPIQLDPKSPRQSVYWYGARNDYAQPGGTTDDTAAYQKAIRAAKAAKARNIPCHVDIGRNSALFSAAFVDATNILFRGANHSAVNPNFQLPGTTNNLAMAQSMDLRFAGFDDPGSNAFGGSGNQWLDTVSVEMLPSGSPKPIQKGPRLTMLYNRDGSQWSAINVCDIARDATAHQIIVQNFADGSRSYGQHIIMRTEPGVEAFAIMNEFEMHDLSGIEERRVGTKNSKSIIGMVAANGVTSAGMVFINADYNGLGKAGSFQSAIYQVQSAVDNFFVFSGTGAYDDARGFWSIHKTGVLTLGQAEPDIAGAGLWIKRSADRPNLAGDFTANIKLESSVANAKSFINFVRTGFQAYSIGYGFSDGLFEFCAGEGLAPAKRQLSFLDGAVGIGTGAPQSCGASNVLFLTQAGAPFAPAAAPTAGVAMIFDGANIIVKRPDGKLLTLSNWQ